ncbi:hypothetical protein [Legionella sp. W05-934-2]|uniref:hypothetical protein n=1 Tax=Legionella sp. W05-934-2 TaxID=1198649 RepID=UPI003461B34F
MSKSTDAAKIVLGSMVGFVATYLFLKETMIEPAYLAYCNGDPNPGSLCTMFSFAFKFCLAVGIVGGGYLGNCIGEDQNEGFEPEQLGFGPNR